VYRALIVIFFLAMSLSTHASSIDSVGVQSAGSVDDYASDNLVITSYVAADGQLRTRFLYRLTDQSEIDGIGISPQNLTGYFSIDVAQTYDLSENEHEIRMGFSLIDQQEAVENIFLGTNSIPTEISWYISTEGLLSGTALNHRLPYNTDEPLNNSLWFSQGLPDELDVEWGPFICIECGFDMSLNLLFMDFNGGNLALNFDDDREAIVLANDLFNGNAPYDYNLNLIAAVPVPAAWLLLVSALPFLVRCKKK